VSKHFEGRQAAARAADVESRFLENILQQVTDGRLILYDEHSRCLSQLSVSPDSLLRSVVDSRRAQTLQ
jgi:hypothetical protein